ncbi:LysM peptidoglycan-binding domain-containing protein [Nocardia harenae]|uniref:LysM peptidoglycan-binding domain-containing protein n=1 Tax=Nocardia harenae TaxID=358707 RepID=UPI0008328B23|nr:LysM peptidoglycan-binding domain-containing protein [Nocardia harenae]
MPSTHTTVAGDTLSAIAQRFYGDAGLFGFIAAANGIADPDEIGIGQVLRLPDPGRVRPVRAGDTLSGIALEMYGDASFVGLLAAANAIRDPDHIEVGWTLSIPDRPGTPLPPPPPVITGVLPYASEPFGVYQPLIGWRSNLQQERVRSGLTNRFAQAVNLAHLETTPTGPHLAAAKFTDPTGTVVGRELATRAVSGLDDPDLWQALLADTADSPAATMIAAVNGPRVGAAAAADPQRETVTTRLLQQLNRTDPTIVPQMFAREVQPWERALAAVQFIAQQHPSKAMFLSPIGILHRFREYFFELGTFLGPPVGHVWISPGGTVELIEVNTRRTLVERTTEQSTESVEKSEQSGTDRDEIADAVKAENASDMKLGVTTSASGGLGTIFQASGSASFNLDQSRKQAQEQTHKRMREQTSKLSSEVKQSFKTTFRTVTETSDTSSRRYVLQNTTSRLVSYQLSRKMRKVAVQVQDLGQQLCWQLYVDFPGDHLDTGNFVHETAAALDPSIKRPDRIPYPPDKPVVYPFAVRFLQHNGGDDDTDLTYLQSDENGDHGINRNAGANSIIQFRFDFDIPPAPEGFVLANVAAVDFKNEQAQVKDVALNPNSAGGPAKSFMIRLAKANFGGKRSMPFEVTMMYTPTKTAKDAIDAQNAQAMKDYTDLVAAEKERLFYETLRKRVKLSSRVPARRPEDLREEERNIIYRKIIARLYGKTANWENSDYHVASELIRYFFDVDAMLYFVAPDWWRPRPGRRVMMNADGALQTTAFESADKKYLFTEESEPAPLGASLGWFLQLDGDANRNAFLNSPWVKAVLPIRPGREDEAMKFLGRPEVAGTDGLNEDYPFDPEQDPPEYRGKKLREVLLIIAAKIAAEQKQSLTPVPSNPGDPNSDLALPAEVVFAHGFNPLQGGISFGKEPFQVFSQWTEILPTEQVVATEYDLKTPS